MLPVKVIFSERDTLVSLRCDVWLRELINDDGAPHLQR
ncbi:hypothetical protein CVCC1112_1163 [Paenarthrobacter nicotinovorans]|nr:hypothetical protein CVCC1112_1163 [Paenarthrobacter nicotinovorans]